MNETTDTEREEEQPIVFPCICGFQTSDLPALVRHVDACERLGGRTVMLSGVIDRI